MSIIQLEDFNKVEMKVGTIIAASPNRKTRIPAYNLIGKQVIAVTNFEPIKVSEVKSEVRILGAETENGVVLLDLERKVPNGSIID